MEGYELIPAIVLFVFCVLAWKAAEWVRRRG
jgi:hypothetical protein